ncbi:MAG TPA: response regulator [Chryseosolibacter sp.]
MAPANCTVLYVEDDLDDQSIFKECLNLVRPDITCEFAIDGPSALEKLRTSLRPLPVCIFIDVNMPVMNGNELLAKIKADPALCRIPCYMLSTSNNKRHMESAIASGARDYLIKPAVYIDFKNLLEETLQKVAV